MNRSKKSNTCTKVAALAGIALAGTIGLPGPPSAAAAASAGVGAAAGAAAGVGVGAGGAERGRALRGAVTIVPGREGIVEVAGYEGTPLGTGSALTLTAPDGATVMNTPLNAEGFRGAVASDGGSGTYTFTGGATTQAWRERTFPFVLAIPAGAVPGTRLTGCALRLTDARGGAKGEGACAVTVGLPEPTLTRPESGVPLGAFPETSGTAFPGARVTVRDAEENEVCATTATAAGTWSCVPSRALPSGSGRLQATASYNGVSAVSEQIDVAVSAR
jgi:hypothetical protein